MARTVNFDSNAVSVVFAGISLDDGRADPFFEIAPNGEAYTAEGPGADGMIIRYSTNNDLHDVTLTLKGSSNAHAKLTAIHAADKIASRQSGGGGGAGVAPLLVKDNQGSTLISTDTCWITQAPNKSFGANPPDVTWNLQAVIPPAGMLVGGN